MDHKTILLIIFAAALLFAACQIIKNKPQYLVLLGIRGLLTHFFIQFLNYICTAASLSVLVLPNVFSILVGAFLGFPGILLLYLSKIYLLF